MDSWDGSAIGSFDLLSDVTDPDDLQFEIAGDEEVDPQTAAAIHVLQMIDSAYAAGKPGSRIPCPFCGRSLRYRKDDHGSLADCPGGDFVCMG